jgi:hypothetical protein
MRAVLNVVGRPKLFSRGVVALVEERVEPVEDQFLVGVVSPNLGNL